MSSTVVHLLDVGTEQYGDCVVIKLDNGDGNEKWVMIDGGHRADAARITSQLATIRGGQAPFDFDLVIVSHAHADHIGALPDLVANSSITATNALLPDIEMAFGPDGTGVDDSLPNPVAQAIALAREEPPDDLDVDAIEDAGLDAVTLRFRYTTMIDSLETSGTNVVPFGNPQSAQASAALEASFADFGFEIIGPSQEALDQTAALLTAATDAAVDVARGLDAAEMSTADALAALDASQRAGFLVNAQSVVCRFTVQTPTGPQGILLGGDFQFSRLETGDAIVRQERDRLLQVIGDGAPYGFAKLSHHGSSNAAGVNFLNAIGSTPVVGISSGRGHPAHPPQATLDALEQRKATLTWVRTDRSGHVEVDVDGGQPSIRPAGAKDLSDPNEPDELPVTVPGRAPVGSPRPGAPRAITLGAAAQPVTTAQEVAGDVIRFEIPARATSLTVKFDLGPAIATLEGAGPRPALRQTAGASRAEVSDTGYQIGGGRELGGVVFLTDTAKLIDHTNRNAVAVITNAISAGGYHLCDVDTKVGTTATQVADVLQDFLDHQPATRVVILGGYDVIPSEQVDVISPDIPADRIDGLRSRDPDAFIVWSDDLYVDVDDVGLPDLPISRVPDGHNAMFMLRALQASPAPEVKVARHGVRNVRRPFVESIFKSLPGRNSMLVSAPTDSATLKPAQLRTMWGYFMLHGMASDATRFWGEDPQDHTTIEAVKLSEIPPDSADVVFLGCCWGALSASTKACDWRPGAPIAGRVPDQSIAMTLLNAGARGVIGCTGAHYSPTVAPFNTASGPLHEAFWKAILAGTANKPMAPAEALFQAKLEFARYVSTLTDPTDLAIGNKTLHQFTCLGLGW